MEPKKNPKYDVHAQRGTIFQISLAITLALVIMAFQWRVPVEKEPIADPGPRSAYDPIEYIVPSTTIESKEAPKAREIKSLTKPRPTENIVVNTSSTDTESSTPTVDQGIPIDIPFGSIEVPEEIKEPDIFLIVEKMPEPVGGYEGFYKGLSKNLKYPKSASRNEVMGKVFVSFVVNEKSELTDFKVLKGIGYGCDEEAIRVIALSKWNAGKQRGRPVKVRMVQTINFRLH